MARFLVTNNTRFEPFSFEELAKPLAYMQEQHNAAQDVYDALNLETSALGQYISENENDSEARRLYNAYNERLKSLQENLWNNGVTAHTRRELAAAREGFAGIQKIKSALERRQANSKNYWDYVHKNPDSIVGVDPGSFGLNDYLKDDTFGNNWFSYSGKDFMSEVGADAKARALEMRERIKTQSEVPGYITRIAERGFTNDEVDAAIDAVKNGTYENHNEGPVKILADTLSDHLKSTGAVRGQNISDEQYDRFFGYGRTGLAQGIFEPEVKDFTDISAKLGGGNGGGSIGDEDLDPLLSNLLVQADGTVVGIKSQGFDDWSTYESKQNKRFAKGEVLHVRMPDGRIQLIDNVWDATDVLYNSPFREQAKKVLGIDIGGSPSNLLRTSSSRQTFSLPEIDKTTNERVKVTDPTTGQLVDKMLTMVTGKLTPNEAKELGLDSLASRYGVKNPTFFGVFANDSDGNLKNLHKGATMALNEFVLQHQKYVEDMKSLNPGINFSKYTISPTEEKEFRDSKQAKDAGITSGMSSSDIRDIMRTKNFVGRYNVPPIVGSGTEYKEIRENYGRKLVDSYSDFIKENSRKKDGKLVLQKGSQYTIKEKNDGGAGYNGTEHYSLATVLGEKDGKILSENLRTVYIDPREIAADPNNPRIEFTTENTGKVYSVPAAGFGPQIESLLTTPDRTGLTLSEKVAYMMMPLTEPSSVVKMSNEDASMWWNFTRQLLGQPDYDISAKDFVRDEKLQSQLLGWVSSFMDIPLMQIVGTTQKSINTIPNMK